LYLLFGRAGRLQELPPRQPMRYGGLLGRDRVDLLPDLALDHGRDVICTFNVASGCHPKDHDVPPGFAGISMHLSIPRIPLQYFRAKYETVVPILTRTSFVVVHFL